MNEESKYRIYNNIYIAIYWYINWASWRFMLHVMGHTIKHLLVAKAHSSADREHPQCYGNKWSTSISEDSRRRQRVRILLLECAHVRVPRLRRTSAPRRHSQGKRNAEGGCKCSLTMTIDEAYKLQTTNYKPFPIKQLQMRINLNENPIRA